jgi:uncharacterized protein
MLSVTGGIPKYLEEINPRLSAEDNIKRLCFTHGGFLVEEFEQIFSDVFLRDSEFYKKIAETLCSGRRTIGEIESALSGDQSGQDCTAQLCAEVTRIAARMEHDHGIAV